MIPMQTHAQIISQSYFTSPKTFGVLWIVPELADLFYRPLMLMVFWFMTILLRLMHLIGILAQFLQMRTHLTCSSCVTLQFVAFNLLLDSVNVQKEQFLSYWEAWIQLKHVVLTWFLLDLILKEGAAEISHSLNKIFNLTLCSSTLPQDWSFAHFVPAHKKNKRNSSNYRPISLTSVVLRHITICYYDWISWGSNIVRRNTFKILEAFKAVTLQLSDHVNLDPELMHTPRYQTRGFHEIGPPSIV